MKFNKILFCYLQFFLILFLANNAISAISVYYDNSPTNTIPENSTQNTTVAYLTSDQGTIETGVFNDSNFYLNSTPLIYDGKTAYSLKISSNFNIDYETTNTYSITVRDAQGDHAIGLNIGDVNEKPVINNQSFSFNENISTGTIIYSVNADDPENDSIEYTITAGNIDNLFSISRTTGNIELINQADYEIQQTYDLVILISDSQYTDTAIVSVNINNVNDNAPVIENQAFSIAKDVPVGTYVMPSPGKVVASDADGNTISFMITSGNTNNAFVIDSNTGLITVNNPGEILNTSATKYNLTVQASDGIYLSVADVRIDIITDNYHPQIDNIPNKHTVVNKPITFNFSVSDSTGESLVITAESSNNNLVPNDNDHIKIAGNGATHNLTVLSGSADISITLIPSYTSGTAVITIMVKDRSGSGLSSNESFDFIITDGENTPQISAINDQIFVENSSSNAVSFTVNDADWGSLTVVASSDNQTLIQSSGKNLSFIGSSDNYTNTTITSDLGKTIILYITPEQTKSGSATIDLEVSDAKDYKANTSFTVTITPGQNTPDILPISAHLINSNTVSNPINISVSDADGGGLSITVNSSNQAVIADTGIICEGSTSNLTSTYLNLGETKNITISLTPVLEQYGNTTISVIAFDKTGKMASESFDITVNAVPKLTGGGTITTYIENEKKQIISNIGIIDADSNEQDKNIQSASIKIISGYQPDEDILILDTSTSITSLWSKENGSLTLNGADTINKYLTALSSVKYSNTSNEPQMIDRIISFEISDMTSTSQAITQTIEIVSVNDKPYIAKTSDLTNFTEGTPQKIFSNISVIDLDGETLNSAKISITNEYESGKDILNYTDMLSISGNWNQVQGLLTLSGNNSLANYKLAIESIIFNNTSDDPTASDREITVILNDGIDEGNPITHTVRVIAVDDAPVLYGGDDTIIYIENNPPVTITDSIPITLADVDNSGSQAIETATIAISSNYKADQDKLLYTTKYGTITSTWNNAGFLVLSNWDSKTNYEGALNAIGYINSSDNPDTNPRTITFSISDGEKTSNEITYTINITPINDPPVLTGGNETLDYTENSEFAFAKSITLVDVDDTQIEKAIFSISGGYSPNEDILSYTGSIPYTWSSESGVLTFTGADTLSNYQEAIREVKYINLSNNPETHSRTFNLTVFDADSQSNVITQTLNIIRVNDAPILSGAGVISYTENSGSVKIASSITIIDYDSKTLRLLTAKISSGYSKVKDILSYDGTETISTQWYEDEGTLVLNGIDTIENYMTALNNISFKNTNEDPLNTPKYITINADDGFSSSLPLTQTIIIIPVNDPPELAGGGGTTSYTENYTVTVANNISLFDPDNKNISYATISIVSGYTGNEDELKFIDTENIVSLWSQETKTLTLTGMDAQSNYQNALRSILYRNTSDNPSTTQRTISFQIFDYTSSSNIINQIITIKPVNDPSVITGVEMTLSYTENNNNFYVAENISIIDADSPSLLTACISIVSGFNLNEDNLEIENQGNINIDRSEWDSGKIVLYGIESKNLYEQALKSIKYYNSSDMPDTNNRIFEFFVYDALSQSNTASQTITVLPVDDPPILTLAKSPVVYTENNTAFCFASGISITDADNTIADKAIIKISNGFIIEEDSLIYNQVSNINGQFSQETGLLELTGIDSLTNYQQAINKVNYYNSSDDPSVEDRYISLILSNEGVESIEITQTVKIAPVNDSPIVSGLGKTIIYNENSPPLNFATQIDIVDYDDEEIKNATIIISPYFEEDVLALSADEQIGNITASWQPGSSLLILSEKDSIDQYISALKSVTYYNTSNNPSTITRTIKIIINDGKDSSKTQVQYISINPSNDPPKVGVNTGMNVREGTTKTISNIYLFADDPDETYSNTVFTLTKTPVNGILANNEISLLTGSTFTNLDIFNNKLAYSHDGTETQYDSFSFIINDSFNAQSAEASFSITITGVNIGPKITSEPIITATEDIEYRYTLTVYDPDDLNNGLEIGYNLINEPDSMTISNKGVIIWTPLEGVLNSGMLTVTVFDGGEDDAMPDYQSFSINVIPVNDLPYIVNNNIMTITETTANTISYTYLNSFDIESDNSGLFYVLTKLPDYGTIFKADIPLGLSDSFSQADINTENVKYIHDGSEEISDFFTFVLQDEENGKLNPAHFIFNVILVNDPPLIIGSSEPTNYSETLTPLNIAVPVAKDLTIIDMDSNFVTGGIVKIISGYEPEEDVLSFKNQSNITGVWNKNTATLTLSGEDSAKAYELALESISYSKIKNVNTSNRIVSFILSDDYSQGFAFNKVIKVLPVDEAPILSSINDQNIYGDSSTGSISFSVSDPEGGLIKINIESSNLILVPEQKIDILNNASSITITADPGETIDLAFYITPTAGQYGNSNIDIIAIDNTGLITKESFILNVNKYIISSVPMQNGTIQPSGEIKVKNKEPFVVFRIIPDPGYEIDNVVVDSKSLGNISDFTFWSVTDNHTIEASFKEVSSYNINAQYSSGGKIEPSGNIITKALTDQSFEIIPDQGARVRDIKIDGISIGKLNSYTFEKINQNHTIFVSFEYAAIPAADFSANITKGMAVLDVAFNDLSTGDILTWIWDFGDGIKSSMQNPKHSYNNPGIYNVSLTVKGNGNENKVVKSGYIEVMEKVLDFKANINNGPAPLNVNLSLINLNQEIQDIIWDFGDGTKSIDESPSHLYETAGVYSICLTATVSDTELIIRKSDYIKVSGRQISGKIIDKDTGALLSNIKVEIFKPDSLISSSAITNANGTYTIVDLPASEGLIAYAWPVDTNSYYYQYYNQADSIFKAKTLSTLNNSLSGINFSMEKASNIGIKGSVINKISGAEAKKYSIDVYSEKTQFGLTTSTDESGSYTIIGLKPSDDYKIWLWYETGTSYYYYISENETPGVSIPETSTTSWSSAALISPCYPLLENIDIIIEDKDSISGIITYNENPIENIWVNARNDKYGISNGSFTDETGKYTINGLASQIDGLSITYIIEIASPDYNYQSLESQINAGTNNIDFSLSSNSTITGNVSDKNGIAVPYVDIYAWSDNLSKYYQSISDSNGNYTISALSASDDYKIGAFPIYYPSTYYNNKDNVLDADYIAVNQDNIQNINFILNQGGVIKGTVFINDLDHRADSGVWVNIYSYKTSTGGEVPTDSNGNYEITGLDPDADDYVVSVILKDYIPAYYSQNATVPFWQEAEKIKPSDFADRNILLQKGFSISGKITYNGKPVPGVNIIADSQFTEVWGEAVSNEILTNGANYLITGLPKGTYQISVQSKLFADKTIENVGVSADISNVDITLNDPSLNISGIVYGIGNNHDVQISAWSQEVNCGKIISIATPEIAYYTLTGLKSAKDYRIELRSLNYPYQVYDGQSDWNNAKLVDITKGSVSGINFNLAATGSGNLSGYITFPDNAQKGESVWIDAFSNKSNFGASASATYNGEYAVEYSINNLVKSDDYIVSVWSDKYMLKYFNNALTEEYATLIDIIDSDPQNINFSLEQGNEISGKIINNGTGASNVIVSAWSYKTGSIGETRSDESGLYHIIGLSSADDFIIKAVYNNTAPFYYNDNNEILRDSKIASMLNTESGNLENINILIFEGESISGIVKNQSGQPVNEALVNAWSEMTKSGASVKTDKNGYYTVSGLNSAQDYKILISHNSYVKQQKINISSNSTDINFILKSGFKISGTINDNSGNPVNKAQIRLSSNNEDMSLWAEPDINGYYEILQIPDVSYYNIHANSTSSNYLPYIYENIFIDSNSQINIILNPALSIDGFVKDINNEAISDVLVTAFSESQKNIFSNAITDVNGYYKINMLADLSDYVISASHKDYVITTLLDQKSDTQVDMMLTKGSSISGYVRDISGKGIAYVKVFAFSQSLNYGNSVISDINGFYKINSLIKSSLNDYVVTADAKDQGYPLQNKGQVNVDSNVNFILMNNKLNEISGIVMDSDTKIPPQGITVLIRLYDENGIFIDKVMADENGSYKFFGLDPDTNYILKFRAMNSNFEYETQWAGQNGIGVNSLDKAFKYKPNTILNFRFNEMWP